MNADEARIMNPSRISNPPSVPLYYVPATSANLAPVVHSQGLSGSQIPMSVACPSPPIFVSPSGNLPSPSSTVQSSDDGGEDSVSGRKVKFLCSSGGKVMPRPSDGMLRYVGGQTRIITVKREVSFSELAQKMKDDCGQHVVMKYQLPDEDLDALVSVSCTDDLENMMDEYDKLLERSPDSSVKLRMFLFLDSEIESSGLMQFGDLQDSGRKYVDAVNGFMTRKESFASAVSTQNSDLSITDTVDNSLLNQDDVSGLQFNNLISPTSDIAAISVSDNTPPAAPSLQLQGLMDFHQDTINSTEYQKAPQLMYTTAPKVVTTPQPLLVQPQQFIPVTHMNMGPPSSNISMSPGMFPTMMQSQRLVAVPSDLGYNAYQAHNPGYNVQFSTTHQQLPHAHSDPVVQKVSAPNPDVNTMYQSLCVDDIARFRPVNNVLVPSQADMAVPQGIMGLAGQVKTNYVAANTNDVQSHRAMPLNGVMENLQIGQPEFPFGTEKIRSPVDQHSRQIAGKEQLANIGGFSKPAVIPEASPNPAVCTNKNVPISMATPNLIGNAQESANWIFLQDSHFPPPRPSKIMTRKEVPAPRDNLLENLLGNGTESNAKAYIMDPINQPLPHIKKDHHPEQALNKVAFDDFNKAELQATVEVSATSNAEKEIQKHADVKMQAKLEGMNGKPEKTNHALPLSDERGHLQIIKNNDLEELRELGSGTFGTVYHGKWRGTDVAIKRINERCFAGKPSEEEKMRDDFWNEASNLADLHHPNVVAFYGVVLDGPGGSVATVTEYMVNGSLRTALGKNERLLDKRKRLVLAMDVAFGMEYLHSRNIVHFDLKSDNLLVNLRDPHRPICKVGDLGLSKVKCQTLISGGVRGTLPWMAPELLNGSSSLVSEKVDVFSFGIVMWELLTGDEPYSDLHYGAIIGGIVSNTLRPPVPENCDPDWKTLMEKCWSAEPLERPSFTQITDALRSMAAKIPPKGQAIASTTRTNVHV